MRVSPAGSSGKNSPRVNERIGEGYKKQVNEGNLSMARKLIRNIKRRDSYLIKIVQEPVKKEPAPSGM